MKSKEMILLVFVGVCAILIVATVATALGEAELASGEADGQLFSVSIGATSTPALETFDFDFDEGPIMPAQFDEGAPEPTSEQGN